MERLIDGEAGMIRFSARLLSVGLLSAGLCITSVPVEAQTSLLDSAKGLLGKIGQSGTNTGGTSGALTTSEISSGLTEAIWVGAQRVIGQLGAAGGFETDPAVHIPLPKTIRSAQSVLEKIGYGGLGQELELALNRGAEQAVPEATSVFGDAIKAMTWQDAQGILDGPDDAATQFFKRTTSKPLAQRFAPIVENALSETGAVKSYDTSIGQYENVPLVPDVKADLTAHVVQKALNALFLYLGKEEAAIRQNPAARSTDLLKKVFSGL
jgi:hypothetical protein